MKLKKLYIEDYKSIKKENYINLSNNLLCIIGKNGSGKTNILEFIKNSFPKYRRQYKIELELNKEDFKSYFDLEYEEKHKFMIVEKDKINQHNYIVRNKLLKNKVNEIDQKLKNVSHNLIKTCKQYEILIKEILDSYEGYEIDDLFCTNQNPNFHQIDMIKIFSINVKKIDKEIKSRLELLNLNEKDITIFEDFNPDYFEINSFIKKIENLKFTYPKMFIHKISSKFITIDKEGIRKEIEIVNNKLKNIVSDIKEQAKYFYDNIKKIQKLLTQRDNHINKTDHDYTIINDVNELLNVNVVSITNEVRTIIDENEYYSLHSDSFLNQVVKLVLKDQDFKINESNLSSEEITKIEKYINKITDKFENKNIKSIKIEQNNNKLEAYIIELTDEKVKLVNTSTGRRWYYSYKVLSNSLKKGDILLLDEPGIHLDNSAKKELLNELIELSKKGIKVIYTTHSPELIPKDLNNICYLKNSNKGTVINTLNEDKSYLELVNRVDYIGVNNILLNITGKIILVEGKTDKDCLISFMENIFDINAKKYYIILGGGDNIMYIHKFLKDLKLDFTTMVDKDTENKPNALIKEWCENNKNNSDFIIVGAEKELEDLFCHKDKINHLIEKNNKFKINSERISNINKDNISKETLNNFKKLFIDLGIL